MVDGDLSDFVNLMRDLARVFPLRGDIDHVSRFYFNTMKAYPLAALRAGAEEWMGRGKYFPKPVDWKEAIPKRAPTDIPRMSAGEAHHWRRAEKLAWEDDPCGCQSCVESGVNEKPLRFVPEFTDNDRDRKVVEPLSDRVVTAGHWAHGQELFRLYNTRADFWEKFYTLIAKARVQTTALEKGLREETAPAAD